MRAGQPCRVGVILLNLADCVTVISGSLLVERDSVMIPDNKTFHGGKMMIFSLMSIIFDPSNNMCK